jgi:hypothetical protein
MVLNYVAIRATAKKRAWPGDVTTMWLNTAKIARPGRRPKRRSDEAIRLAAKQPVQGLSIEGCPTLSVMSVDAHLY